MEQYTDKNGVCYNQYKKFQEAFNKLSKNLYLEEHQRNLDEIKLILSKGIADLKDLFNLNNWRQKKIFMKKMDLAIMTLI